MDAYPTARGEPRKSWQMRKRQERIANEEGLAEWQVRGALLLLSIVQPHLWNAASSKSALCNPGQPLLLRRAGDCASHH